jgi:hypothetical protein
VTSRRGAEEHDPREDVGLNWEGRMTDRSRTDRRQFLKTVGLAGLTSALPAPVLSAAPAPAPSVAPPPPAPAPPDTAKAAAPAIGEDARALADIIGRRYGRHLSKEQLESIARDFDGDLKALERMREVKLANGDEPDFTFRAHAGRP